MSRPPDNLSDAVGELYSRMYSVEQRSTSIDPTLIPESYDELTIGGVTLKADSDAPLNFTLSPGILGDNSYIDLDWDPPVSGSAVNYIVKVAHKQPGGGYILIRTESTPDSELRVSNLLPNNTYGFIIIAQNALGVNSSSIPASGYIDGLSMQDSSSPAKTLGLVVGSTVRGIVASWTPSSEQDVKLGRGTYQIQVSSVNTFASTEIDERTGSTVVALGPLVQGQDWFVRVRAIDSSGNEGAWSDTTTSQSDTAGSADISNNAVGNQHIGVDAVHAEQIEANAVTTAKIAADAVTAGELAADAVGSAHIQNLAVNAAKVAANAITTAKIATGAVEAGQLALNAVTTEKIASAAVVADSIGANAIIAGKIAANAVTAITIAADSITSGKIAAGAIQAGTIAAGAVTAGTIAANVVTATEIAANAITASAISAGAVTASKVAAGAITASSIAANSIISSKINAGAIIAGKIAADAVTATTIAAGAVKAESMAVNSVTASAIAADAVTAVKIAADTITAGSAIIADAAIGSAKISDLTAAKITSGIIGAENIVLTDSGAGALIMSGNYDAGIAGWFINGTGDAEFNDVIIRGSQFVGGAITLDTDDGVSMSIGPEVVLGLSLDTITWKQDAGRTSWEAGAATILHHVDPITQDVTFAFWAPSPRDNYTKDEFNYVSFTAGATDTTLEIQADGGDIVLGSISMRSSGFPGPRFTGGYFISNQENERILRYYLDSDPGVGFGSGTIPYAWSLNHATTTESDRGLMLYGPFAKVPDLLYDHAGQFMMGTGTRLNSNSGHLQVGGGGHATVVHGGDLFGPTSLDSNLQEHLYLSSDNDVIIMANFQSAYAPETMSGNVWTWLFNNNDGGLYHKREGESAWRWSIRDALYARLMFAGNRGNVQAGIAFSTLFDDVYCQDYNANLMDIHYKVAYAGSDPLIKDSISRFTDPWTVIRDTNVWRYSMKNESKAKGPGRHVGLMTSELPDWMTLENEGQHSLDQMSIIGTLWAAVQDLDRRLSRAEGVERPHAPTERLKELIRARLAGESTRYEGDRSRAPGEDGSVRSKLEKRAEEGKGARRTYVV